jgi:hypothetical protein
MDHGRFGTGSSGAFGNQSISSEHKIGQTLSVSSGTPTLSHHSCAGSFAPLSLLKGVGGLTALLAKSDAQKRQHVYRAAGVHLRYQRSEEGDKVTASARVGLFRVGGAYDPLSTPAFLRGHVILKAA